MGDSTTTSSLARDGEARPQPGAAVSPQRADERTPCPNCIDLSERLRCQAATNLALIKEHRKLQERLLERGLREIAEAECIDFRLKNALIGGVG